ncbi:MAG: phosphoribosylglycinamide formyltransferase [Betaproteobacteria bacterium]|nr:MAG: phosphoribosylglycinamide formyltransferase [Betaproteobacteria bacterium]TDI83152.1 MAG: phosphoribosylglycinamide formyltransferase [Betaproteobacteria bacterium]
MKSLVILISGRGSNMRALLEARLPVRVAAVISNNPEAAGLEIAKMYDVETGIVDHRTYPDRAAFDIALARKIDFYRPSLVALAGFMRMLGDGFVNRYKGKIMNVHPSLLPSFPGLGTHERALEEGVRIHGCTVHFVTPRMDHGPIIVQAAVRVLPDDTNETLAARVLQQEHRIYPEAVHLFMEGRLKLSGSHVEVSNFISDNLVLYSPELHK